MKLFGVLIVIFELIKGAFSELLYKVKKNGISVDHDAYVIGTGVFVALYLPIIPMIDMLSSLKLFIAILVIIMIGNIYFIRDMAYFFGNLLSLLVGFLVGGLIIVLIAHIDTEKQVDIGVVKFNKEKVIIDDGDMHLMTKIKGDVKRLKIPESCKGASELIIYKDIESVNYLGDDSYSYEIRCDMKQETNDMVQEMTPIKGKK